MGSSRRSRRSRPREDQLAKILPGLSPSLPVTLIYDYPTIATITQLVADRARPEGG